MNELQILVNDNEEQTVSGRELHTFLEIETPYHKWFPRMCEYGFAEKSDYLVTDKNVHNSNGGKQSIVDHILKLDMAKELCMLARNEKGKQARQYFLEVEREWNSPEKVMARALRIAEKTLSEVKTICAMQEQQIAEFKPIKEYVDTILSSEDTLTVSQIAADYGISAKKLNVILNEEKIQHKVNGQWLLYSNQMNKGYTKSRTFTVSKPDGGEKVIIDTMWTQKGRLKIHELLTKRGIKANMDKELN